jgi:tetratricopeptide (TPR) repeat protein
MTNSLETYRPAARATPALVGRKRILEQIRFAIEGRTDTVVLYIHGDGGIGKTRLLTEVLRLCRDGAWKGTEKPLLAVEEPVDLYHTQTHVLEGLVRAMGAVMKPETREQFFTTYTGALWELESKKPDLRYALRDVFKLRDRVAEAFVHDFQDMTSGYRSVIAFDTAEVLLYDTDIVQQRLHLETEGVSVRSWLVGKLFPSVSNTVFLIAGRPRSQLLRDLEENLGDRLQVIDLDKFSEEETLDYFNEVAAAARADNEEDIAQRIENIQEESRKVMHILTGGQPILLSLVIDLLALAKRLPDEVKISLAQAQSLSPNNREAALEKLEASIVNQFQQVGSPADEAIRSLAFARKGMDPALLARVADMTEDEAKEILSALTGLRFNGEGKPPEVIPEVRRLSFIKVRPADRRVFLHDEMYALMERHVLKRLPDESVKRVQRAILAYYADELERTRKEIARLQPSIREEVTPDRRIVNVPRPAMPPDLLEERAKKGIYEDYLMSEQIHYLLRYDPLEGFQTYCDYVEDAYEAADDELDMQLRDELLAFVNAPEHEGLAAIEGLNRAEVDLDAGIRWIRRNDRYARYSQAVEIARRLRDECPDLIAQWGEIGQARLDVWGGMAHAYHGLDLVQSESLLRRAVKWLRGVQTENKFLQWHVTLASANAYNCLGYLLMQQGRQRQAVKAYRSALPLWRQLGKAFETEHANTLNNLSWALAQLGDLDNAIRQCMDGLELRTEAGARYPIALSYNTLGQIQIRYDQPHRARTNCERALAIFRELEMPRGTGMACTALAEAYRRMGATDEVYFPEERVNLMREAEQYAREAVTVFGPYESWPGTKRAEPLVPEPARLVNALIELGCAYRDWARLWPNYTPRSDDLDCAKLVQFGESALHEAAEIARSQQPHRAVDALVNLAWLKYYIGDVAGVEAELKQVQAIVKDDYFISTEEGLPSGELDQPFYWVQLGKVYLLKGHIAFNRYFQADLEYKSNEDQKQIVIEGMLAKAEAALKEAASMYALSLAYDDLYGRGQRFRDLKRAETRIHDRLKGLNVEEMQIVKEAIQAAAVAYHLGQPRLALLVDEWFGLTEELEWDEQSGDSSLATTQI